MSGVLFCLVAGLAGEVDPTPAASTLTTRLVVASLQVTAADGVERLVAVGTDGRVAILPMIPGDDGPWVFGEAEQFSATLSHPGRCLFAFAPTEPGRSEDLWVSDPDGFFRFPSTEAGFEVEPERVLRRAKFDLYTGVPLAVPFLTDVDEDGRPDLSLPGLDSIGLYWNRTGEDGELSFERGGSIGVRTSLGNEFEDSDLSFRMRSSLVVPQLELEDLNGDSLPDLIVREERRVAYHLASPGEGFARDPSVLLDLALFRDNERRPSSFGTGRALEFEAEATVERRDLDGDGLPDFVVFQGRKLWVFLGSDAGPQFEQPSTVLKSAEPITGTVFMDLDEDRRPELVLLRLEIPTLPSLILGLFSEWDIPIQASAYRAQGEGRFETRPFRSREVRLRLPPILSVIRDPYTLLQRFRGASNRFRDAESADLDGDGRDELLLLNEDRDRLEVYGGRGGSDLVLGPDELEALLREQLFETEGDVWDTDRLLAVVGDVAVQQVRAQTEGATPSATIQLDLRGGRSLDQILLPDVDGDGRAELVVSYRIASRPGMRRLDLHRVQW